MHALSTQERLKRCLQCVTLNMHGRFGQSARKTIIVGILTNYVTETVTLTLWS